jgi:hypothetical protein
MISILRRILRKNLVVRNLFELLKNKESFSQMGEDMQIQNWIFEEKGKYLDIGAGEPIRGSNTFRFYQKGWTGILVDPISSNYRANKFFRPRDEVVQALIGIGEPVDFWNFDPYQYSTMDAKVANDLISFGKIKLVSKTTLQRVKMESLGCIATPNDPFFLSLDVEGSELEVLMSNDWEKFMPRIICVEIWYPNMVGEEDRVDSYLYKLGYECKSVNKTSSIFVHRDFLRNMEKV